MRFVAVLAGLGVLLPANQGYGLQSPAPLADRDLQVPGLTQGEEPLSQKGVRRVLGAPDSVVVVNDSGESVLDESSESWSYYRDLVFASTRYEGEGVLLTTSRFATARGLRVGDTAERLMKLYGKGKSAREAFADTGWVRRFLFPYDSAWTYHLSMSPEEREGMSPDELKVFEAVYRQLGITVWVRSGKVACIYIGRLITDLSWWGCPEGGGI